MKRILLALVALIGLSGVAMAFPGEKIHHEDRQCLVMIDGTPIMDQVCHVSFQNTWSFNLQSDKKTDKELAHNPIEIYVETGKGGFAQLPNGTVYENMEDMGPCMVSEHARVCMWKPFEQRYFMTNDTTAPMGANVD